MDDAGHGATLTQPLTAPAAMPRTNQRPETQIDDQRHQRREDGRRHVDVVEPLAGGGVDDVVELHRHRQVVAPGEHQAEDEVVPDAGHLHDHRDHDDRQRHRQHQLEEDAPEAAAVDARGLEQLAAAALRSSCGTAASSPACRRRCGSARCRAAMPNRPTAASMRTSG